MIRENVKYMSLGGNKDENIREDYREYFKKLQKKV